MATDNFLASCDPIIKNRRVIIAPKPSHKLNLWSIMKNSIGKDLSKIPLPVSTIADYCNSLYVVTGWVGYYWILSVCVFS